MSFPKQAELEIPLLQALLDNGGSAEPKTVYPKVEACFPDLTPEDQEQHPENSPAVRKWWNLVQWARQRLVQSGEIDGSTRGVWKLTDAGRAPLSKSVGGIHDAGHQPIPSATQVLTLRDLSNRSRDEAKVRLLDELKQLTPTGFERFCMELLQQLGYRDMEVTKRSADGGIDGHGVFRQGAVNIRSAFQAKKWENASVGRPEIDKLRGAIQGDYDHGVFITTSRFTKSATEFSYKNGAITILLLDGDAIPELMLERGIGVVKQPVYLDEVAPEFFDFDGGGA